MRKRFTPVLLGICLLGPGCSFARNVQRNIIQEPKVALDEAIMIKRHERIAHLAWDEMTAQYGCDFSCDYQEGFIDGFVDYLTFGGINPDGDGEVPVVPAVPPPKYRHAKAMSPQGLAAAEDWFKGFRHGSNTALASGLRQLAVVPVFDRPIPALEEVQGRFRAMPGKPPSDMTPPAEKPPEGEPLPPPRTVPPGEGEPRPPAGPAVPPGLGAPAPGPAAPPPAGPAAPPPGPGVPPVGPAAPPPGPGVPPG